MAKVHRVSHEERTVSSQAITTREAEEPFFAVYHQTFVTLLGSNPSIELALEKDYPFAHEAGVYFPDQDAIYITSNRFKPGAIKQPAENHSPPPYERVASGTNDDNELDQTIWVSKLSRRKDGSWVCEKIDTDVVMGNGGINYQSGVLFCDQGSKTKPGGLVLMEAKPPYTTKTLVDGFHGRLFNSVNDVVLHTDGSIWFVSIYIHYRRDAWH